MEQRRSCDSAVGMCVSHGDSWVGNSLLRAALKISRSVPTERGIFAADREAALKAIPLMAQKKNEP